MASLQIYSILFLVANILLLINAEYIAMPNATRKSSAVINQNISFVCRYRSLDGSGGDFSSWWKDNVTIDQKTSEHYKIITNQNQTKLIITFNESDAQVERWAVRTSRPGWEQTNVCEFQRIQWNPSPRYILTNKNAEKIERNGSTIRRVAKEGLVLNCINEPHQPKSIGKNRPSVWQYSANGSQFGDLPAEVKITNLTAIAIDSLQKTHGGYYQCSLNRRALKVYVRVKDPYAALWPFVGIVSTVIVLIGVILFFEKRHQDAKKKAAAALANDEVNDNATKPLVITTNKLVDEDNMKRATVNA